MTVVFSGGGDDNYIVVVGGGGVVVAVVVCRIRSSQVVVWVCVIVSYRVIHGHPIGNLKNASRSSGNHGKLRFCHVRSRALIQTKRHLEAWDAYTVADHAFRIAAITPMTTTTPGYECTHWNGWLYQSAHAQVLLNDDVVHCGHDKFYLHGVCRAGEMGVDLLGGMLIEPRRC